MRDTPDSPMFHGAPPPWSLARPKPVWQSFYDFVGAPLRMIALPDHVSEGLHLTSLRAERLAVVLRQVEGRLLDIGAGDNMLVKLYESARPRGGDSVGVDVYDWGGGCTIVERCDKLPFDDGSFDTVSFVACINHIPERREALREAFRVLRPGGKLIVTMIGKLIGTVGHAIWWYSEDKHRDLHEEEVMGMDTRDVTRLIAEAGFCDLKVTGFVYSLNSLYTGRRPSAP